MAIGRVPFRLLLSVVLLPLLFCSLSFAADAGSGEPPREPSLVLAAFDSSAAGDFAYLGDSIRGMLASRLATGGRLRVLDRSIGESELAALRQGESGLPESLAAVDYLATGSIYALASGVNIQLTLYPLNKGGEIGNFSVLARNPAVILSAVEELATEILAATLQPKEATTGQADGDGAEGGLAGFVTAHPEIAYKQGQYSGTVIGIRDSLVQVQTKGMKRSTTIPRAISAMALGDLTGDGTEEMVTLAGSRLEVFRSVDRTLASFVSYRLDPGLRIHALNLADLNGDGRVEIYLSATDGLDVASMVLAWQRQGGFTVLAERLPWYLRPLSVPGAGWRLAGQERGGERLDLVRPGVFLLDIDTVDAGFRLSRGRQLPLPRGINLFDFVYADVDGDGGMETVAVDRREKLRLYGPDNQLLWVSRESYAASSTALGPSMGMASERGTAGTLSVDEEAERETFFLPGRLQAVDVNGDGRDHLVVNQSESTVLSFFHKLRSYEGGAVLGLAWDGEGLVEAWRTGNFRGYIADHSLRLDGVAGDGQPLPARLAVAHQPNRGSLVGLLPGSDETELALYDLEFTPGVAAE